MRVRWAAVPIALLVVATRFCHLDLLWIEEAYPMAAAAEVLRGKALYRDIWFDKPPLYALTYCLWGATPGWPLRLAGILFVLLTCYIAWHFMRRLVGETEAITIASLAAFHLTFDISSSSMALAPDLLTVPLHLSAVLLAMQGRCLLAGVAAGVALLYNSKAIFVLLSCLLWAPKIQTVFGFVLPNLAGLVVLAYTGSLGSYYQQVWEWGMRYSADTFVAQPWKEAALRTLNWAGFHAAIVIGSAVWLVRRFSWRVAAWMALSLLAVCAGWRFFPRYYFHLLPVFLFAGVRGLFLLPPRWRTAVLCTLLVPFLRFAPRYVSLASGDRNWADLAMMQDSAASAAVVRNIARPGNQLLVWGYRPDVYVFSGLPAATRFLDSQPLNGVLADRHLTSALPTVADIAVRNQPEIERARPDILVDGLGPLNHSLAAGRYPFLRLDDYEVAGRTNMSIIYVRKR